MKRKTKLSDQHDMTFNYHQNLTYILRDLQAIDRLIPREASLSPHKLTGEAAAIIVHRKDNLLRMIQTICRDHLLRGNKLLRDGWEPAHKGKFVQREEYRNWNYLG
jgi:hypothetical protein